MADNNGTGRNGTENVSFRQLYALLIAVRKNTEETNALLRALKRTAEENREHEQ